VKRDVFVPDTDGFEDCGAVVVDGVDSGGILPEEEGTTEEESVGDFGVVDEA